MAQHVGKIDAAALLGVGGALIRRAGTKPRRSDGTQPSELEWLFRLANEPRRLPRRYLIDSLIFVACAIQQRTARKSYA